MASGPYVNRVANIFGMSAADRVANNPVNYLQRTAEATETLEVTEADFHDALLKELVEQRKLLKKIAENTGGGLGQAGLEGAVEGFLKNRVGRLLNRNARPARTRAPPVRERAPRPPRSERTYLRDERGRFTRAQPPTSRTADVGRPRILQRIQQTTNRSIQSIQSFGSNYVQRLSNGFNRSLENVNGAGRVLSRNVTNYTSRFSSSMMSTIRGALNTTSSGFSGLTNFFSKGVDQFQSLIGNGRQAFSGGARRLFGGVSSTAGRVLNTVTGAGGTALRGGGALLGAVGRKLPIISGILAAIDGGLGAANAESILGRDTVTTGDRVRTGAAEAASNFLSLPYFDRNSPYYLNSISIPDTVSKLISGQTFAQGVDSGAKNIRDRFFGGADITNLAATAGTVGTTSLRKAILDPTGNPNSPAAKADAWIKQLFTPSNPVDDTFETRFQTGSPLAPANMDQLRPGGRKDQLQGYFQRRQQDAFGKKLFDMYSDFRSNDIVDSVLEDTKSFFGLKGNSRGGRINRNIPMSSVANDTGALGYAPTMTPATGALLAIKNQLQDIGKTNNTVVDVVNSAAKTNAAVAETVKGPVKINLPNAQNPTQAVNTTNDDIFQVNPADYERGTGWMRSVNRFFYKADSSIAALGNSVVDLAETNGFFIKNFLKGVKQLNDTPAKFRDAIIASSKNNYNLHNSLVGAPVGAAAMTEGFYTEQGNSIPPQNTGPRRYTNAQGQTVQATPGALFNQSMGAVDLQTGSSSVPISDRFLGNAPDTGSFKTSQPQRVGQISGAGADISTMNDLMRAGLSQNEAAAYAGGFAQESEFQPNGRRGDNGSAFGLAQWREGRLANLRAFAAEKGLDINARATQARFVVEESTAGSRYADPQAVQALAQMRANPNMSTRDRALLVSSQFERPSAQWANNSRRVAEAERLAGLPLGEGGVVAPTASNTRLGSLLNPDGMGLTAPRLPNAGGDLLAAAGQQRGSANLASGRNSAFGRNFNPQTDLTTIKSPKGEQWTVNKESAFAFQGFVTELENMGYPVRSSGGYSPRRKRGGAGMSEHAFGTSIDVNAPANPFQPNRGREAMQTDLPANISDIAAKYGLSWGGDWEGKRRDPMHFEYRGIQQQQADSLKTLATNSVKTTAILANGAPATAAAAMTTPKATVADTSPPPTLVEPEVTPRAMPSYSSLMQNNSKAASNSSNASTDLPNLKDIPHTDELSMLYINAVA